MNVFREILYGLAATALVSASRGAFAAKSPDVDLANYQTGTASQSVDATVALFTALPAHLQAAVSHRLSSELIAHWGPRVWTQVLQRILGRGALSALSMVWCSVFRLLRRRLSRLPLLWWRLSWLLRLRSTGRRRRLSVRWRRNVGMGRRILVNLPV